MSSEFGVGPSVDPKHDFLSDHINKPHNLNGVDPFQQVLDKKIGEIDSVSISSHIPATPAIDFSQFSKQSASELLNNKDFEAGINDLLAQLGG